MTGYSPSSPQVVRLLAALLAATIAGGLVLTRRRLSAGRVAAWLLLVAAVADAERLTAEEPGGLRMLGICAALFFGMKAVVGTEHLSAGGRTLTAVRWIGFALGWPGMNPAVFASRRAQASGGLALVRRGLLRAAAGGGLVFLARLAWLNGGPRAAVTILLLAGLSLLLHFGLFNLSAGAWRLAGLPCTAPFDAPLSAREPV